MKETEALEREVADYWRTSIIGMAPGRIAFRGVPVQDLIGNTTFAEMIWRLPRTDLPSAAQAKPGMGLRTATAGPTRKARLAHDEAGDSADAMS